MINGRALRRWQTGDLTVSVQTADTDASHQSQPEILHSASIVVTLTVEQSWILNKLCILAHHRLYISGGGSALVPMHVYPWTKILDDNYLLFNLFFIFLLFNWPYVYPHITFFHFFVFRLFLFFVSFPFIFIILLF